MKPQANPYPLRLDPILMAKIKNLAKLNDRSFKGQIENILKTYVKDYETEQGEIYIDAQD